MARVPVLNTLDQFRWDWPTQMNRLQVQNHFRLSFIKDKANLIYLGGVGLGKTPLATALGSTACLKGSSVLCASAIDVINTLAAAKSADRLTQELKTYTKPALLRLDELGYLPIDKAGADLLFQVISLRYEQGSLMITSNRALKEWPKMFNHASTLTSALLDRLLHHAETVIIEGNSFRMRGKLEHEARLHQVSPEVPYGEPGGILPHLVSTHIFQPPIFQHFHAVGNTSLSCYKGFCRKFSFESIWGMISLCESR
jgi:DNA replication protein DnaC